MEYNEIVLLLCGNFNPISNMHLRMFEMAKDYLTDIGYSVYRGLVSPYEHATVEQNLASVDHRIAMIKCALTSSTWVQLSTWRCEKFDIPTISNTLQQHQSRLDCMYKSNVDQAQSIERFSSDDSSKIVVKWLCGADILPCLKNADAIDELHKILINHGVVVISRAGFDVENIIYENDVLWTHRKNIFVVKDQFENQISSRKIRKAVSRGQSIKYLVNDAVERYIQLHSLYTNPDYEYTTGISNLDASSLKLMDSFREFTYRSHSHECGSSTETLTSTLPKKSKLSHRNRKRETHFKNVDRSKLIEIPLTKDGVIQIIADRETNL